MKTSTALCIFLAMRYCEEATRNRYYVYDGEGSKDRTSER